MITENNIKSLEKLVSQYSYTDYLNAAEKIQGKRKNGLPKRVTSYSLSSRTMEAREMLNLARKKNISKEETEQVKGYLLRKKLLED